MGYGTVLSLEGTLYDFNCDLGWLCKYIFATCITSRYEISVYKNHAWLFDVPQLQMIIIIWHEFSVTAGTCLQCFKVDGNGSQFWRKKFYQYIETEINFFCDIQEAPTEMPDVSLILLEARGGRREAGGGSSFVQCVVLLHTCTSVNPDTCCHKKH
jgi:hypothetical protein